jgi:hypothetical protein
MEMDFVSRWLSARRGGLCLAALWAATASVAVGQGTYATNQAQWGRGAVQAYPNCPCPPAPYPGTVPAYPGPQSAPLPGQPLQPGIPTAPEAPVLQAPEAPQAQAPAPAAAPVQAPSPNQLAGTFGGARGPSSPLPNMIGDFFGTAGGGAYYVDSFYGDVDLLAAFPTTPGGLVGRTKIAENTNPIPQDRFFYNYSYFDNVGIFPGGIQVHRHTSGVEKTFLDGMASIEVRLPVASTLDNNIDLVGDVDTSNWEVGDLASTVKVLLLTRQTWALSGGLTVTAPTANDIDVTIGGEDFLEIENESVHLMPFLGWLWMPTDRLYVEGFLQYDVDVNGSPVHLDTRGRSLHLGTIQDTTFQYVDVAGGYKIYQACSPCSRLQSAWLTAECHWNSSLNDPDEVLAGPLYIGNPGVTNIDVVDLIAGAHFQFQRASLGAGYAVPVGDSADQPFDGELRVMFNWFYGRRGIVPSSF